MTFLDDHRIWCFAWYKAVRWPSHGFQHVSTLSLSLSFWRSIRTVPLAKFPNFPKRGVINSNSRVAGLKKHINEVTFKQTSGKSIPLHWTKYVWSSHLQQLRLLGCLTWKKHNFIASEDCKHRNGLWFCAMDLHHAHGHDFHPKARQKLCRLSCSKHTEESQVAPGYRCFFFFGATFEFLMFNRRTQPSTGHLLLILLGLLNLETGSLLWAFLAVKFHEDLYHTDDSVEKGDHLEFVFWKGGLKVKCLKCYMDQLKRLWNIQSWSWFFCIPLTISLNHIHWSMDIMDSGCLQA